MQHFIHQPIVTRLDSGHVQVTVGVLLDALDGLAGMVAEDLVQIGAQAQDFLGLDGDVGRLAARAAQRLVQVDGGVGQGIAHALGAGRQQDRAEAGREADGDRGHGTGNLLHGVVDGHAGVDLPAGGVDVHADGFGVILAGQPQQLGDDQVSDLVVDGRAEDDDPLLQQEREDVIGPFAPAGRFDDHRDEGRWNVEHGCFSSSLDAGGGRRQLNSKSTPRSTQSIGGGC